MVLAACATRPGSPVLPDNAPGPRAEIYVFNVSRGTLIPLRRHVTIDGFPLASLPDETWRRIVVTPGSHEIRLDSRRLPLETTDGGVYFVAVGYRPRREWLHPSGTDPIFIRRLSEADALRLFTELKQAA
ncbi:MAG TPA: hypothetical protein VFL90_13990 [Methylomirabilota bacterium]|nr:hypothetical protein [Methylomirabilota bacterium]